jgi:hypothetical protein
MRLINSRRISLRSSIFLLSFIFQVGYDAQVDIAFLVGLTISV